MQPEFRALAIIIAAAVAAHAGAHGKGRAHSDGFGQTLDQAEAPKRLVGALAEISGLTPASPTSVYAHNDEAATIFELDIRSGKILRTVSLGRPAVIGDFEAIAALDGGLSIMTSAGVIYEAKLEPRRRTLSFKMTDTGLGGACEIEGFAPAKAGDAFFVACKRSKQRLVIYKWTPKGGAAKAIDVKLDGMVPNPDEFRATDMVNDHKSGTLLILDSSAGAILEVSMTGESAGYWRLGGKHPQAEGLALLPDGRLLVADEGKAGRGSIGSGVLTLYPPRH